jgi:hypothetical protein
MTSMQSSPHFSENLTKPCSVVRFSNSHCQTCCTVLMIGLVQCMWSKKHNLISDVQFGFKTGYSASNAIFVLHWLVRRTLTKGKRLFCCFLYYQMAFDRLDRKILFFKLSRYGIDCQILNVIRPMYSNIKACLRHTNQLSYFFQMPRGIGVGGITLPITVFFLYQ